MNEGRKYFQKQEDKVSDLYMSANGNLLMWRKGGFSSDNTYLENGEQGDEKNLNKNNNAKKILMAVVVVGVLIYAFKKIGFKPQID